tara:strand:- start:2606 stop:3061 length:456 start_codon:yes stop_codon:yes gene_type:complete
MARVGRASRNSSLLRVETLDLTADKTMGAAESGEVYITTADPAANRTLTLPAAKEGAYVKVIVGLLITSANLIIKTSGSALIIGNILFNDTDGTSTTDAPFVIGDSENTLTLLGTDDGTLAGSYVELICDGTNWYVTGQVIADQVPTFTST